MEICEDDRLKLAMHLSFACSLRLGEVLGLTWDCVDISSESIEKGTASLYVTKELQRVEKDVLQKLDNKDVLVRFPEQGTHNRSVLILKKPKTLSSVRKVFIPVTVANMLVAWKAEQEETREELGPEYLDYNLVMASPIGTPTEASAIHRAWKHLIEENDLPKVVFHSLRHTSITYKLKLNGGDIKAVQGDSGHAQAKMVTDQYSHILDKDRKENARLVEEAFYGRHGAETPQEPEEQTQLPASQPAGLDAEMLAKILNTPELSMLLKVLATKL